MFMLVSGKLPPIKLPPRKLPPPPLKKKSFPYEYFSLWKLPPVKISLQKFAPEKIAP